MNLEYCGSCGKHWSRIAKQAKHPNGKPKTRTDNEPKVAEAFVMPMVGLPLGSQVGSSQSASSAPAVQPSITKPLKNLLHQRANRLGKVESRIQRLQKAVADVKQNFPVYVNKIQQHLRTEHQKCLTFCSQATEELAVLQKELQDLISGNVTVPSHPSQGYAQNTIDTQQMSKVQEALATLTAAGLMPLQPSIPAVTPHMEVDAAAFPDIARDANNFQDTYGFHVPNIQDVLEPQPVMNPMSPRNQEHQPPGSWTWPLLEPIVPELVIGQDPIQDPIQVPTVEPSSEQFPNPLYRSPILPVQPDSGTACQAATSAQDKTAPEVAQAVNAATQGMQAWCFEHGLGDGQTLPVNVQAQLNVFAEQQKHCHAIMQSMQQGINPPSPAGQPQSFGPILPTHKSMVPFSQPFPPKPRASDGGSVHSSPAKSTMHMQGLDGLERYSLSPKGQRIPKIPRAHGGDVHTQPRILEDSPEEGSKSPTPVPTEVATPTEEQTDGLQKLE